MKKLSYYFSDLLITVLTLNYFFIKKIIKSEISNFSSLAVLDFGCGTGALTKLFNNHKYLGFDIDDAAIDFARRKLPDYKFEVGDATKFDISRKFDLVLIVGVLHHLKDCEVEKVSWRINRLLSKKGKTLIIEATHPINKLNFPGLIIRNFDKGCFIRSLGEYVKLLKGSLIVKRRYLQKGGLLDYAVLVATRKNY